MRLDLALVDRGLSRSRNQAASLIEQGHVKVNGQLATKPSQKVQLQDDIEVAAEIYVARSAEKLIHALDSFSIIVPEFCLDVGASTGGFTQVLLERGAKKVIALDVGTNQLAEELKGDDRVVDVSGVNIREVSRQDLPFIEEVGLTVVDLSFISLKLVAEKLVELTPQAEFVILIKPQFELQKSKLNRHGVVESREYRIMAVESALQALGSAGLEVLNLIDSPITGSSGNREFLAHLKRGQQAALEGLLSKLG